MTGSAPVHLVPGQPRHGVSRYAGQVAEAVGATVSLGVPWAPEQDDVQVHFTDRLWGESPDRAVDEVLDAVGARRLWVTLHDVPQASDGAALPGRCRAYGALLDQADAWATSSHHERHLVAEHIGARGHDGGGAVIPLPIVGRREARGRRTRQGEATTVGVAGFFYPGKGHREVVDAVASLTSAGGRRLIHVVALGGAAPGHEADLTELIGYAEGRGVSLTSTGWLSDTAMDEAMAGVDVPVVAPRHLSASGSLNSWIAVGRRPVVTASDYTREMESLRPGCHLLVEDDPSALAAVVGRAIEDPSLTRLPPGHVIPHMMADAAEAYRTWWGTTPDEPTRAR